MTRIRRKFVGGGVYHVMNRANGRLRIFRKRGDFLAFEKVLEEALERLPCRLLAYCVMSNHWHLLLRPYEDGDVSEFVRWLTVTHVRRWHTSHGTVGIGHVYQGRFKSFPVQTNAYFLTALRYIESNPMRAGIVERAEDWEWSSLAIRNGADKGELKLAKSPVRLPANWSELVNVLPNETDLLTLNNSVRRGCPFGSGEWVAKTARELGLEVTLKPLGRPRIDPNVKVKGRKKEDTNTNTGGRPKTSTINGTRSL